MLEGMFAACCCDGTLADDAHVMVIEGAHVAMGVLVACVCEVVWDGDCCRSNI